MKPGTYTEKELLLKLLDGHYLVITKNAKGKRVYKLMTGNHSPVTYLAEVSKQTLDLLKQDSKKRYTLNLLQVRRLHGNNKLKRQYKAGLKKSPQCHS